MSSLAGGNGALGNNQLLKTLLNTLGSLWLSGSEKIRGGLTWKKWLIQLVY